MEVFGGRLMAEMDAVPDRVVDVPIEETVVKTAEQVLGEIARPPAFLLLRCGGSVGRWLESMTFGLIGTPRPAGTHAGDDGALVVVIEGTRGAGRLVIDSATMLVIQVEATARPNSAGGGGSSMVTDFDTRIGASAETRSAHIEPGHRMVVSTIDALTRTMTKRERLDVGDAVPDFTLPSTSGGEVTLSDLRGSVVVLDFWARWCAPCRAGLPGIQRLYDATGRNEAGVLVYGLNVQDGGNLKGVTEFWSKEKFRFPSLVSDSLEINRQWGIDGIPVTIVIAPDGTVLERVDGYTKGEWKHLAERAQAAQQP
jgi:peroxiredoxin